MVHYPIQQPARTIRLRPILLAALLAFLLGGAIVGYAAWRYDWSGLFPRSAAAQPVRAIGPALPGNRATPLAGDPILGVAASDPALSRVAEQQGGIEQRLVAAEQRLARLDLQAQAASGNAARAEGLLIAFAARRAIDRGAELGFLADQLRLRFGDAMPNAVATVIDGSRQPVTLNQLVTRLETLGPRLSARPSGFSLGSLRSEFASLFVIRRDTTPSVQPVQRLGRARLFLESGRVPAAIAEVRNLPGAADAARWIADAERYAAMQRALDLIETSAVLEPRRLRDRNGVPVEQPSPAAGTAVIAP